jgi:hypothetical protein
VAPLHLPRVAAHRLLPPRRREREAMPKIVAIHPNNTPALAQLSTVWMSLAKEVIAPTDIVEITGEGASRLPGSGFSELLQDQDVFLITGLSHGTGDSFLGHGNIPLFPPLYASELSGKIIHLLSCSTAETLGPQFVRPPANAQSFVGYTGVVNIDDAASWIKTFIGCDIQIDIQLYAGQPLQSGIDECLKQLKDNGMADKAAQLCVYSQGQVNSVALGATIATRTTPYRQIVEQQLITPRVVGAFSSSQVA